MSAPTTFPLALKSFLDQRNLPDIRTWLMLPPDADRTEVRERLEERVRWARSRLRDPEYGGEAQFLLNWLADIESELTGGDDPESSVPTEIAFSDEPRPLTLNLNALVPGAREEDDDGDGPGSVPPRALPAVSSPPTLDPDTRSRPPVASHAGGDDEDDADAPTDPGLRRPAQVAVSRPPPDPLDAALNMSTGYRPPVAEPTSELPLEPDNTTQSEVPTEAETSKSPAPAPAKAKPASSSRNPLLLLGGVAIGVVVVIVAVVLSRPGGDSTSTPPATPPAATATRPATPAPAASPTPAPAASPTPAPAASPTPVPAASPTPAASTPASSAPAASSTPAASSSTGSGSSGATTKAGGTSPSSTTTPPPLPSSSTASTSTSSTASTGSAAAAAEPPCIAVGSFGGSIGSDAYTLTVTQVRGRGVGAKATIGGSTLSFAGTCSGGRVTLIGPDGIQLVGNTSEEGRVLTGAYRANGSTIPMTAKVK